jgi:hypothetical protein
VLQRWCGGKDAAALNDSAVTDAAEMLQQQLTLAGGEAEELEEVTAEEAVQSDWGALPGELLLQVLRDGLGWQREASRAGVSQLEGGA